MDMVDHNFEIVKCVAFVIVRQIVVLILTPTPCQVFISDLNFLNFEYWRQCVRSCVFCVQGSYGLTSIVSLKKGNNLTNSNDTFL